MTGLVPVGLVEEAVGLASAALSLIEEDIGKVQRAEREYLLMDLAEVGVLCVEEHVELART